MVSNIIDQENKIFTVDYQSSTISDVRTYQLLSEIKEGYIIELTIPSEYQITGDKLIRDGKNDPICVVEKEWFKQRKVDLNKLLNKEYRDER